MMQKIHTWICCIDNKKYVEFNDRLLLDQAIQERDNIKVRNILIEDANIYLHILLEQSSIIINLNEKRYEGDAVHTILSACNSNDVSVRFKINRDWYQKIGGICLLGKLLLEASDKGNLNMVQFLCQLKIPLDTPDNIFCNTALMMAITKQHSDIVNVLLSAKVDINLQNKSNKTAFILAIEGKYTAGVLVLIKAGVDPTWRDPNGEIPIAIAIRYKYNAGVKILLDHGVAEKHGVQHLVNVMIASITYNNIEGLKILLQHGISPDLQTREGFTALIVAAKLGYLNFIKELLAAGANPNLQTINGDTAFMYAARIGGEDGVKLFLEAKANPNLQNKRGETGLILATAANNNKCVSALLQSEVDLHITAVSGRRAINYLFVNALPPLHTVVLFMIYDQKWQITFSIQKKAIIFCNNIYTDRVIIDRILDAWKTYYRRSYEGILIMPEHINTLQSLISEHPLPLMQIFLAKIEVANTLAPLTQYNQMSDIDKQNVQKQIMRQQYFIDLYYFICMENKLEPCFDKFIHELKNNSIFNAPIILLPLTATFLLGTHKRIGVESPVQKLPIDILYHIAQDLRKEQPLYERASHIRERFSEESISEVTKLAIGLT